MGNVAMSSDLELTDWLGKFVFLFDTNIFVSYPHDHDLLLNRLPREMTDGRQNIVYLAWEQRDGSPYWPHVFERTSIRSGRFPNSQLIRYSGYLVGM